MQVHSYASLLSKKFSNIVVNPGTLYVTNILLFDMIIRNHRKRAAPPFLLPFHHMSRGGKLRRGSSGQLLTRRQATRREALGEDSPPLSALLPAGRVSPCLLHGKVKTERLRGVWEKSPASRPGDHGSWKRR